MIYIERQGPRELDCGPAIVSTNNAPATFNKNSPLGEKKLIFNLYLKEFYKGPVYQFNLQNIPRIPNMVYFDFHPNEEYSMIGRGVWEQWCDICSSGAGGPNSLPSYTELIGLLYERYRYVVNLRKQLYPMHVILANDPFNWPQDIPILKLYVSEHIPSDCCCLGRDILKYGSICMDLDYTYFIPKRV
jgi:hypothetical protein